MSQQTILVEMTGAKRTWEAMYAACQLAREAGDKVVLVKMLPLDYLQWIADDCAEYTFSEGETEDIRNYHHIADEFEVAFEVRLIPYTDWESALVRAADELNARIVFARPPESIVPFFHHAPLRHLQHVMEAHHHELHPMEVHIA